MKSNPLPGKIMRYFGVVMSLFYLCVGLLFLFTNQLSYIFPNNRTAIGIVFSLYAVFRIFIAVRKMKRASENNREED